MWRAVARRIPSNGSARPGLSRRNRSTSARVTRPATPVPVTRAGSTPFSDNNRRTTGESNLPDEALPRTPPDAGTTPPAAAGAMPSVESAPAPGWPETVADPVSADVFGVDAAAGAGSAAGTLVESTGSMRQRRAPTATTAPSPATISASTPASGDGTSESTLSVETSYSGWSAATDSPTPTNQRVMVPSVTVSPSCGRRTSVMSIVLPVSRAERGRSATTPSRRRVR